MIRLGLNVWSVFALIFLSIFEGLLLVKYGYKLTMFGLLTLISVRVFWWYIFLNSLHVRLLNKDDI